MSNLIAVKVQGIARNVQWRERHIPTASTILQVLSFTVEITDRHGDIQKYVPVYLESRRIEGVLSPGDEVRVIGETDENGTLKPEEITNITTEAKIGFQSYQDVTFKPLDLLLILIIFLGGGIAIFLLSAFIYETGVGGAILLLIVLSVIYLVCKKYLKSQ